jgi:hypothetical protein
MAYGAMVGKLNSKALTKAVAKTEGLSKQVDKGAKFKDVLNKMEVGTEFADMLGMGNQNIDPTAKMQSLQADGVSFSPADKVTEISRPQVGDKVLDMMGEVNKGQMQMDSLVNHVLYSGKRFSNQELMVIQAHVFQFAQMTELTVKVAEQGVSSVKSVLNTQVQ